MFYRKENDVVTTLTYIIEMQIKYNVYKREGRIKNDVVMTLT